MCLSATKVTDDAFQSLGKLKALKKLDMAGNSQITGSGLPSLTASPTVEWLKLAGTAIDDHDLAAVGRLTTLRELLLSGNRLTDAGLKHLAPLSNLAVLEVKDTGTTAAGVAELQKALPKCKIVANVARGEADH